ILEIGPGLGALTRHLVGAVKRIVGVELDDELAERLRQEFAGRPDFQLIHGDALELDLHRLDLPHGYKAIGNIPYNITTPLLFRLLERDQRPRELIIMVQKEVAARVTARPGHKDYGALSVGVQSVARAERLFNVGRGAFRPVPGVDSTVLRITPYDPPPLSAEEEDDLRMLTRAAFSQRRKQFQKILRTAPPYLVSGHIIDDLERTTGLNLDARPETFSADEFRALAQALRGYGLPGRMEP
ncbi:MAG TPA: 16S rRNA (adenine(1518)-N(6)/adenine(1519)-N(6))-dimethyltransferase RsmA, partial [Longimicrobiales bacterium]|nr:16S rRNA (adenine(1518)-N(6)/adenine(1519)-N(6))-dimethyltransferase RsmA [Longimicrobiales bacterium]